MLKFGFFWIYNVNLNSLSVYETENELHYLECHCCHSGIFETIAVAVDKKEYKCHYCSNQEQYVEKISYLVYGSHSLSACVSSLISCSLRSMVLRRNLPSNLFILPFLLKALSSVIHSSAIIFIPPFSSSSSYQ